MASIKFWNSKEQQFERAEIFDSLDAAVRESEREFRQIAGEYHEPSTTSEHLGNHDDGRCSVYGVYKIKAAAMRMDSTDVDEECEFVAVPID